MLRSLQESRIVCDTPLIRMILKEIIPCFGFVSSILDSASSRWFSLTTITERNTKSSKHSIKGKSKSDAPSMTKNMLKLKKNSSKPSVSQPLVSKMKNSFYQWPTPRLMADLTSKIPEKTIVPLVSDEKGILHLGPSHLKLYNSSKGPKTHFTFCKCYHCGNTNHILVSVPLLPRLRN